MAKIRGTFTADAKGLAQAVTGPRGAGTMLALRAARRTVNQAKENAPVGVSGLLRQNITADPIKARGLVVESGVTAHQNYALYVHQGVKGGKIIRPVRAKALKFEIGGRTVFAKSVKQGAQKARPFLYNGAQQGAGGMGFTVSRVP